MISFTMPNPASPAIRSYFDELKSNFDLAYEVAKKARGQGLDPEEFVEIAPARDVASRVEGLVGPPGIAERIREVCAIRPRDAAAFEIAKEIMLAGEVRMGESTGAREKVARLDQAVRTGLAIVTEGVVSAPIEGVSRVALRKNPDGSDYLAVSFAGPIRGAGGTGQAMVLLIADYCRQIARIGDYRPTQDELDRYVEEIFLYSRKTRAGQYVPTEEEIRHIASNCPVCIDGEPSEDYEVSVKKDLKVSTVDGTGKVVQETVTNKVRSGVALVMSEGLCLKAAKVLKISRKQGLDWAWLEKIIKVSKQDSKKTEIKPITKYMDEIVAGRPIFSYPMRPGGFRLRYGRTPLTGIASKAIHPAAMEILGEFPAVGTQLKIERPGKGAVITPCAELEPPVVRLFDGSVVRVESIGQARSLAGSVSKILFLGDLLCNYGDFSKANHLLVPSGYCEEWHAQELEALGVKKSVGEVRAMSAHEAIELSRKTGVALSPSFTYFWHDIAYLDAAKVADFITLNGSLDTPANILRIANSDPACKTILETLCIPHSVAGEEISFSGDDSAALLASLGLAASEEPIEVKEIGGKGIVGREIVGKRKIFPIKPVDSAGSALEKSGLDFANEHSGIKVMAKAGIYIGSSMGRPEKAKPRKMKPPVNSLFPIGLHGGKIRSVVKAVRMISDGTEKLEVEVNYRACGKCGAAGNWKNRCIQCGAHTLPARKCSKCGALFLFSQESCKCGGKGEPAGMQPVALPSEFKAACDAVNCRPEEVKAVMGLISLSKTPEPLEKGVLRAKHGVTVFRDGTGRFDATEIPATHFTPRDCGTPVEKLRELGYAKDYLGNDLVGASQVFELRPQDVILNESAAGYFLSLSQFVDDLLEKFYGLPAFYNASTAADLVGIQLMALAPHTSAAIACRLIGFCKARALIAHPYLHCATRRNCDGDELAVMLSLDALLNFSKTYLPESRGGKMDAPLVLTVELDPTEVDDEVHAMDVCFSYPLEFYRASLRFASPSEVKLDTVSTRLGTEAQFEGLGFTHAASLEGACVQSSYVTLGNMAEKVEKEIELMERIRAVDAPGAAERILLSHFFPDLYGNLRSFSRQSFRCVDCNAKFRRVPLVGKCLKCHGKLLLTINRGGIEKYLRISKQMVEKHGLPNYLRQRLVLVEKEIASIFDNEEQKQVSLAEFI